MAFRRTLSERLLGCRRASPPATAAAICSSPAPASDPALPMSREYLTSPEPGGRGLVPRFLQRRSLTQFAGGLLPEILSLPVGERLRERLRSIGVSENRLTLDGLSSPAPAAAAGDTVQDLSVLNARKLLRLALMERLKAELREISESSIPYGRYLEICSRACENVDQGLEFAKMMDDCGSVIVLGNVVFLRPEQVAKSMEAILHQWTVMPNDPRRAELDQMEEQKSEIDRKARALVRAELYCGLGLMAAQTLGFMRLTFWELSWDVMEPICFFVTSLHFALAYCFFLRTSNEPSFEGYFNCRFRTKQEKLMRAHNFDVERYNELYRIFYPKSTGSSRGKERYPALDHAGTNYY